METSIPWYKSPVYLALIVNVANGIVQVLGFTDVLPPDLVNTTVANVLAVVALAAAVVGEVKRRNSPLQPITLTQKSPE